MTDGDNSEVANVTLGLQSNDWPASTNGQLRPPSASPEESMLAPLRPPEVPLFFASKANSFDMSDLEDRTCSDSENEDGLLGSMLSLSPAAQEGVKREVMEMDVEVLEGSFRPLIGTEEEEEEEEEEVGVEDVDSRSPSDKKVQSRTGDREGGRQMKRLRKLQRRHSRCLVQPLGGEKSDLKRVAGVRRSARRMRKGFWQPLSLTKRHKLCLQVSLYMYM